MQHHPGSWYIPWGVPLQKMLAVPMHPATNPSGYSSHPGHPHQPQTGSTAVQMSSTQQTQHQNYHFNHAALHHTAALQQIHPTAAAAMFSPLSLRAFLGPPHNPLALNQQSIATTTVQQQPQATQNCLSGQAQPQLTSMNLNVGLVSLRQTQTNGVSNGTVIMPIKKVVMTEKEKSKLNLNLTEKRKADDGEPVKDLKKAKLETKALKAKRPGFTDERYYETSYYIENGLRKVYPYYFTFTTFTKGRWVGEKILDVFAREFRAHPAEEYERCIKAGTLTVNYEKVPTDYRLKHNDLLANVVHRHETPVLDHRIKIIYVDNELIVLDKPCSLPVHPCGRYRHNTVVFILAKEYNLKNLRTIHRLDRLTSGLLLFGRSPKKARQMEHQIRNRQVQKEYVCRVEGEFPDGVIECKEPIEVVSYKIGVCKVSSKGKECTTIFQKIGFNGKTSVVLCKPRTGRMHQIRVHLQYLGYPVVNDPLYNHEVFGPSKGKGGDIGGKSDDELVRDLINIHNAENWLGIDGDTELSLFKPMKNDSEDSIGGISNKGGHILSDDDSESVSREASPCSESPRPLSLGSDSPHETNNCTAVLTKSTRNTSTSQSQSKVTVATQTGHESPDLAFNPDKMTTDKHCYECKVRYRDPKPQDLVMYLHAWKYRGPGWEYETELPEWAKIDWVDLDVE